VKAALFILWLAALALAVGLIVHHGIGDVLSAAARVRWGLLWVLLYHIVPLVINSCAWRLLLEEGGSRRLSLWSLTWMRWIGEAVNILLPVAQVGGDLVRARLAALRGIAGPRAVASVLVDVTAGLVTQVVFVAMGIAIIIARGGHTVLLALIAGLAVLSILLLGFYVLQRYGMARPLGRLFERRGGRQLAVLVGNARIMDQAVDRLYQGTLRFLACCGWRLAGWIAGAGEILIALAFLSSPVGFFEALMIESLTQALRSAAFLIPGALGVQEGAFVVLGELVGLRPEVALALALVRRLRELVAGVPALLIWQVAEGRHLFRRRQEGE
jgi:putative membrane protein